MRTAISLLAGLVMAAFVAAPAQAELINGLENYWNFDNNLTDQAHGLAGSSSTVADNGVFDGTNGTSGISYGSGLLGSAGIQQDGADGAQENNGFVRVARSADTLHGGESISISMWFETTNFDTNWQTLLAHGEGNQYRVARRGGDAVAAYAGGSGDIPGSVIGPDISAGTGWHHVVAISEAGVSTRLWVDGSLVDTGGAPSIFDDGNSSPANPDLYIGANPQTGANNREWGGGIDDVAIWNRPLDPTEIAAIYDGGVGGSSLGNLLNPVPEPGSFVIWSVLGALALGFWRRRRNRG